MDEPRSYAFLGRRDRSVMAVSTELQRRRHLALALRLHAAGASLRGHREDAASDRALARRLHDPTQLFRTAELDALAHRLAALHRGARALHP